MPKISQQDKEVAVFAETRADASGFAGAFNCEGRAVFRRATKTGALYLDMRSNAEFENPALIPVDVFRCTPLEQWLDHAWPDGSPTQIKPLEDLPAIGGRIESAALAILAKLGKPIDVRKGVLCTSDGTATVLAPESAEWHLGTDYQIPGDALSTAELGATMYQCPAPAPAPATGKTLTIETNTLRCVTSASAVTEHVSRASINGLLASPGANPQVKNAKGAWGEVKRVVEQLKGKWTRVARGDDLITVAYQEGMYDASELAQCLALHGRADMKMASLGQEGEYWLRCVSDLGEGYQLITMTGPK